MKAGLAVIGVGAIFFALLGCQASVNAHADANISAEGESADAHGSAEMNGQADAADGRAAALVAPAARPAELGSSRVLLGARHDLRLSPGKATATCECLAVALGGSRSAGMAWSSPPPELDDSTQLAIALSSDGVECKGEPKGSLGASYWGYRISGNDVIVLVEGARGGRPLTSGAIIPRPVGPGQVFVAPASRTLPYGRPPGGKGSCKIGNPGQARSGGFSELEVGLDAPTEAGKARTIGADDPTIVEVP